MVDEPFSKILMQTGVITIPSGFVSEFGRGAFLLLWNMQKRGYFMKRIVPALFLLISLFIICGGCTTDVPVVSASHEASLAPDAQLSPENSPSPKTFPSPISPDPDPLDMNDELPTTRSFTDMLGNNLLLPTPENIERVAVLTSPQVQNMYIVGMQDKLCAMTTSQERFKLFERFFPGQADIPAPRGTAGNINVEVLLASNPQFCIGSKIDMDVVAESARLPVVNIDTDNAPEDVFLARKAEVSLYGEIFGAQDRAQIYCDFLDEKLELLAERTMQISQHEKMTVYFGFNDDLQTTYGKNSFMNYQIEAAGLINAAEEIVVEFGEEGGLVNLSMEQILAWDPDIIVIDSANPQVLKKHASWGKLTAVQNDRVYMLPIGGFIWNRPSSESAALLPLWLSKLAYPDLYEDISVENEIKRYWAEVLRFEITDDDIYDILRKNMY